MCKTAQSVSFMTLNKFPERFYQFNAWEDGGTLQVFDSQGKKLKYLYKFADCVVYVDDRLRRGDLRQDIRDGLPEGYDWPFAVLFGRTADELEIMLFWVASELDF